ncbi:TPA: mechanosensitive ion channel, partial [Salmonella enterica subsp. enterica serovar Concord]|nr:mechanosensitive ion channel [Salmonella enterica subsp. enterica serovar Concord]
MEYLARLNIVAMLMSTTFWINLAVVFFVTLITYWLINWLLNVVYKALQRPDKKDDAHGRLRPIVFEMLKKTSKMLIFFAAFLFSLRFVALPDRLFSTLSHAWFLVVAIQMAIWLDQGVQSWMRHLLYAPGSNKNPVTLVILGMILRVLVWSMMLLSILANVGVDITALVASLGVGGIAIALAVQTVLSDVFASLSIGFDKPFEIGDFVVFNDVAGTIEHIG